MAAPRYETIEVPASEFYGAAANFVNGKVTRGRQLASYVRRSQGHAIALNPYSDVRACIVFVDDDTTGQPLLAGGIIVGDFHTFAVAPVMPSTFLLDTVPGAPSPAPLLCPQVLRLDVYREGVPPRVQTSEWLSVQQELLVFHNPTASTVPLLTLHAPSLVSIRLWASNGNTVNPGNVTIGLYPTMPQMLHPLTDEPRTDTSTGIIEPAIGTVTLLAAADNGIPVTFRQVDPGALEYAIAVTYPGGTPNGDYTMFVGAELTFYRGH